MSITTIAYGGYKINREEKTVEESHPVHGNIHFKLISYNFTTKNWTKYKHCPAEELDHYLPIEVLNAVMQQWPEDFIVEPRDYSDMIADRILKEND
jgi:hypothetical protein